MERWEEVSELNIWTLDPGRRLGIYFNRLVKDDEPVLDCELMEIHDDHSRVWQFSFFSSPLQTMWVTCKLIIGKIN